MRFVMVVDSIEILRNPNDALAAPVALLKLIAPEDQKLTVRTDASRALRYEIGSTISVEIEDR